MSITFIRRVTLAIALISISLLVPVSKSLATHFAAIDLYATFLGDANGCSGSELKYEIVLVIYGNCGAGSAQLGDYQGLLHIESENAGHDETVTMDNPILERDTVDQLCPALKLQNACRIPSSPYPGYFKNTYTYIWTCPSQQEDWIFWWESNARNSPLNIDPSKAGIYVQSNLNNLVKAHNSTPRFTQEPFPFLCQNQPAFYLNGPTDPNKDSIVVSIVKPMQWDFINAKKDTIDYVSPFSIADPMGSDPNNPFKFDPNTGTASFTPAQGTGKYALAFRCDEYERKTGKRMGYILRDVQVTVLQCNAPPPPYEGNNKPIQITNGKLVTQRDGNEALLVCPGNTLTFDVSAKSTDPNSLVYLESNVASSIPSATFSVPASGPSSNGTAEPLGTFTWTPQTNHLGEHILFILAKDSTCSPNGSPIVLRNPMTILIKVMPGLDAGPDLPICPINPEPQQLFVLGTDSNATVDPKWTAPDGGPAEFIDNANIANPVASPKKTTSYVVSSTTLENIGCRAKDTVTVYVDTSNSVDVFPNSPVILCKPDYLQLDADVKGKGPISNMTCGINSPQLGNPVCANPDSIGVFGSPVFGRIPYDTAGGASPTLYNQVRTAKFQFLVNRNDMRDAGIRSATIRSLSFETIHNGDPVHEYSNFRISFKCTDKESLSTAEGFESNMMQVYASPVPITFADGVHEFKLEAPYNWDTTKNLLIEFCYSQNPTAYFGSCSNPLTPQPPIIKYAPTTQPSMLAYFPLLFDIFGSPAQYVPDTGTNTRNVCGMLKPPADAGSFSQASKRPIFGFKYCDAPYLPFTIKWEPGDMLSDSTILQPLAYVPKSIKYTMETFGNSGCLLRDSVEVYVPSPDFSVWPKDTAICFGEKAQMEVRGAHHAIWWEHIDGEFKPGEKSISDIRSLAPLANPTVTTSYKVEVADSVWCFDTLDVTVIVNQLPDVQILNRDTIVRFGQQLELHATGARRYNWTPPSSLSDPNNSLTIATPTEPTEYIVAGIGRNGCRSFDTLRVGIDYRDNLMIPTGFTPNGDGKNDRFRVANLTFQRVMEFRVFNRWGQEVFSGNNNTGWDGKWKGVSQDMGNYQYVIRLGYPDGHVESYKGEVTLIR